MVDVTVGVTFRVRPRPRLGFATGRTHTRSHTHTQVVGDTNNKLKPQSQIIHYVFFPPRTFS